MHREMKKWLGQTPTELMTNEEMQDALLETGYG